MTTIFLQLETKMQHSQFVTVTSQSALVTTVVSGTSLAHSSRSSMEELHLKKSVGLFNGITMVIGLVVGSGIFVSPAGVLRSAGSVGLALAFWVLGGIVACIGSMVYVELGTTFRQSGGDYSYIGLAFGPLAQMCYVWACTWIVWPVTNAIMALTFSSYILEPFFPGCQPQLAITLLAAAVIVLLTAVNSVNVDWAARLTGVFTVLKMLALALISITGLVYLVQGKSSRFENVWENTSTSPMSWAKAIYNSVFAYSGWNYLNLITEEVKEPHKTLPRAIWISIPIVTLLYTSTNVAFMALLSTEEQLQSAAVAVAFGDKTLGIMSWIIPLMVACSTFGTLNGSIFMSSRLYLVAARKSHLPRILGTINAKFLTPMVSLVFQCIISLCMLLSSDVLTLISYSVFVETSFIGLTVASMLRLRKLHPNADRPRKVSLVFPILYLCFCIFLLVMTLAEGAKQSLIGVAIVASAIPVYLIFVRWEKKPKIWLRTWYQVTVAIQKLFYSLPEEGKQA